MKPENWTMDIIKRTICALMLISFLDGCTMYNSYEAHKAKDSMVGMSDYDLESCIGVPDQKAQIGNAEILTYYDNTTNNGVNMTLPIVGGGVSLTGSGCCHATFTLVEGRVAKVQYTGDNSQLMAPHSICAPIVNGCIPKSEKSEQLPQASASR
jgi:hypothetical protein